MTDDVGEPLAQHPAEELLGRVVGDVGGRRKLGSDPGGAEQLAAGGQLAGQGHLAVVGYCGTHVTQRPPAERGDLADLAYRSVDVVERQLAGKFRLHGDRRKRVAEQVVQVAGDPRPLVLSGETGQFGAGIGQRPVAEDHPAEAEHRQRSQGDGQRRAVVEAGADRVVPGGDRWSGGRSPVQ